MDFGIIATLSLGYDACLDPELVSKGRLNNQLIAVTTPSISDSPQPPIAKETRQSGPVQNSLGTCEIKNPSTGFVREQSTDYS